MSHEFPRVAKREPRTAKNLGNDLPSGDRLRGDHITRLLERGLAEISCGQITLTPAGRRILRQSKLRAQLAAPGPSDPNRATPHSGAIEDILAPGAILHAASATSPRRLLDELGALASRIYGLDAKRVAAALRRRESVASTGMCAGVALPHAHLPDLGAPVGLFARLRRPVEFGADDGMGVDLVFALLSPSVPCASHLRALAQVSRLLRDGGMRRKLRETDDPSALYVLLTDFQH